MEMENGGIEFTDLGANGAKRKWLSQRIDSLRCPFSGKTGGEAAVGLHALINAG